MGYRGKTSNAGSRYSSQSQLGCEKRLIPSMWGMSIRAPRFAHQKTLTHSHTLRFVTHQQKTFAEPTVVGSTRNLSQCLPLSSLFHTPPSSSPMRVWRLPYVHIPIIRHFSNALAQPPPERKAPTNSFSPNRPTSSNLSSPPPKFLTSSPSGPPSSPRPSRVRMSRTS